MSTTTTVLLILAFVYWALSTRWLIRETIRQEGRLTLADLVLIPTAAWIVAPLLWMFNVVVYEKKS